MHGHCMIECRYKMYPRNRSQTPTLTRNVKLGRDRRPGISDTGRGILEFVREMESEVWRILSKMIYINKVIS